MKRKVEYNEGEERGRQRNTEVVGMLGEVVGRRVKDKEEMRLVFLKTEKENEVNDYTNETGRKRGRQNRRRGGREAGGESGKR